jgi:tryptophan-rich sensory protein
MESYRQYYEMLEKPFFAPEPWVFGFMWGIIYPLILITFVLVIWKTYKEQLTFDALLVLTLNILANLLFTPLQLQYPDALWSTLDILLVFVTLCYLQWGFLIAKEYMLFALLLPYLLWGTFATVLQMTIYHLNFL